MNRRGGGKNDIPASRKSVPETGPAARKRRWRERQRLGLPAWKPPPKGTALGRAIAEPELPLGQLTVLKPNLDPFRLDTPANHRNGQWFAEQIKRLVPHGSVHLRGLHYRIVAAGDVCKPSGGTYTNTDEDWNWLIEFAAKPARWLGYVPFDRIVDERNDEPEVWEPEEDVSTTALTWLHVGHGIVLPDAEFVLPRAGCSRLAGEQPYRIIFVGEKSSLGPVLRPIAGRVRGELILPTGEMTDTLIYWLAQRAHQDTRPAVVLYFSDFDPAGWAMPANVSRKLQALAVEQFPDLKIEVHAVALTLDQVREYDLPSTPLKETERRGDRWREVMGREQTEIDALAALRPGVLRDIAEAAVEPFFDYSLGDRAGEAHYQWHTEAIARLEGHPDYQAVCAEIEEALEAVDAAVKHLGEVQQQGVARLRVVLPKPEIIEPEIDAVAPPPLFTTDDDFVTATTRLVNHKKLNE
jgi:hypothetical protein